MFVFFSFILFFFGFSRPLLA